MSSPARLLEVEADPPIRVPPQIVQPRLGDADRIGADVAPGESYAHARPGILDRPGRLRD